MSALPRCRAQLTVFARCLTSKLLPTDKEKGLVCIGLSRSFNLPKPMHTEHLTAQFCFAAKRIEPNHLAIWWLTLPICELPTMHGKASKVRSIKLRFTWSAKTAAWIHVALPRPSGGAPTVPNVHASPKAHCPQVMVLQVTRCTAGRQAGRDKFVPSWLNKMKSLCLSLKISRDTRCQDGQAAGPR